MKKVYSILLTVISSVLSVAFLLFLIFFPSRTRE
ncbi:MAG: hypothetical protein KatS3mg031_2401 [Chitinophagales bacterium]|nr:MAG: hypothetical protein KatS3mg031_2401 [Chitinophagales bacterium]